MILYQMISYRSFENFVLINGLLIFFAFLFNSTFELIFLRNLIMGTFLEVIIFYNYKLTDKLDNRPELSLIWLILHIAVAALFEFFMIRLLNPILSTSPYQDLISFCLISFPFELLFDLQHYIMHRLLHSRSIPSWLSRLHQYHHHNIKLRPFLAFYQNPIDLVLTNVIPFCLSFYVVNRFYSITDIMLSLLLTYKVYTEIAGHCGVKNRTTCFPQCIWLPRFFGIQMYTEDHDLHHKHFKYNFSKRFMLWDIIFDTQYPKSLEELLQ